jgi:hypothetical protein
MKKRSALSGVRAAVGTTIVSERTLGMAPPSSMKEVVVSLDTRGDWAEILNARVASARMNPWGGAGARGCWVEAMPTIKSPSSSCLNT